MIEVHRYGMKLLVLALDYDGTIAKDNVLDAEVRKAIAEVRGRNITVILVTGRILDDLRQVAGDLHFADVIVAENGAVIYFPASGYSSTLAPPPPANLLQELRLAGLDCKAGQSIIDASSADAPRLLSILQKLELPLVLAFNRGRVMILPQAISKATGLARALSILRLSEHNAVAIGDAENDHELLRACEAGVAVGWGSPALKSAADHVLEGSGPQAVAAFLRTLAEGATVPTSPRTRRRLLLGHIDDGRPLSLAVRGRNLLIAGDPKSGKSWVTGLLCEQLILLGYSLCILDPEGDYTSLEALPGVVVFGGSDPLPKPRDLLRALRHADVSVVIDLSRTPHPEKLDYCRRILPSLAILRRHTGLPHRMIVDEAHYFLHDAALRESLDLDRGGYTFVTYRASKLDRTVLDASQAVIVTRESDPREVAALYSLCSSCASQMTVGQWMRMMENLAIGEAVALPVTAEAEGEVRRIRLAPRLTPHVRHVAKYLDVPVPERNAFYFARNGSPSVAVARTLRQFVEVLERTPEADLRGHLVRNDFSRWIANVFGDYPLAHIVAAVEDEYRRGVAPSAIVTIVQSIRARYEFVDPLPEQVSKAVAS